MGNERLEGAASRVKAQASFACLCPISSLLDFRLHPLPLAFALLLLLYVPCQSSPEGSMASRR
jgi:hypothetical protein